MLNMQLVQAARKNVRLLLQEFGVAYGVTPFNEGLYQGCIEDAMQRGYPVDDSVQPHLCLGVIYAASAGAHLSRPTQIWIALYITYAAFVDDIHNHCTEEIPSIYLFNNRLIRGEPHEHRMLDALADIVRRTTDLFPPVASHLITTSTMNFVTATLLEYETRSMKISSAAQQYPTYQRTLSGLGEAFGFFVFSREIPTNDYIQAIPEVTLFMHNANDVLSFYKEEQDGDTTNQISTLAARTKRSKLEILDELTGITISQYKKIMEILEGSPEACGIFERFATGYLCFHISASRYRLQDLGF